MLPVETLHAEACDPSLDLRRNKEGVKIFE